MLYLSRFSVRGVATALGWPSCHGGPLACSWDIALCPSPANLNGDCFVNTQDFVAYLGDWAAGCP